MAKRTKEPTALETPSPHPTIRVSGVTRKVDARLYKIMSDICHIEPQRITFAELGSILDAGFQIELYARTDNIGVLDYDGLYDRIKIATLPKQLGPEWRERFVAILDDLQKTKAA